MKFYRLVMIVPALFCLVGLTPALSGAVTPAAAAAGAVNIGTSVSPDGPPWG